jgi:hypothetical protein
MKAHELHIFVSFMQPKTRTIVIVNIRIAKLAEPKVQSS